MIGKWKGCGRAYTESDKQGVISILSTKQYKGFKPTFASEKLRERSDTKSVNRETLRQWMMSAGLWSGKKRNKLVTHQSRARRSRAGELVQIDGSHHDWFEGRAPKCCLLVFIDDATSSLMHLRFESAETTMGYFRCVKAYILKHGRPAALYSDRYGVFTVNVPDKVSGLYGTTQFQRAMKELKIEMILANSPQAKGRVERANQTLQDRLIKEMRLLDISSMEEANAWLPEYIEVYNDKFAHEALDATDGHRALDISHERLDATLSIQETRRLSKNLEVQYKTVTYQVQRPGTGYGLRHAQVAVCERMDGTITIHKGEEVLKYETIGKSLHKAEVADRKEVDALLDSKLIKRAIDKQLARVDAVANYVTAVNAISAA
jgi:hypothetical protein